MSDSNDQATTVDVIELRAQPALNAVLSQEEKAKILRPSILDEGSVVIDNELQVGLAMVDHPDGVQCIDIHFHTAVSRDGGRSWEDRSGIKDLAEQGVFGEGPRNVFGFGWTRLPSGKIGTGWIDSGRIESGHRFNKLWWRTSSDNGETWSGDVLINPTGELHSPSHLNPIMVTSTGRIIVPARMCYSAGSKLRAGKGHNHYPEIDIAAVYYSDDEGQTWRRCDGDIYGWLYRGWGNCVAFDEPQVEELPDGRLMMFGRSTIGRLLQTFSEDGGESWSIVEPTKLASSYSPCALKKIPSTGDLVCVWNQVGADEIRLGKRRCRLSAAISSDGITWKHFRTLERFTNISDADYIKPDDQLIMCRAADGVEFPDDFGTASYPTIGFHGDDVILSYPTVRGTGKDLVSAMKIRVLPLEWFYAAP